MRKTIFVVIGVFLSITHFAAAGILVAADSPDEICIYSDAYTKYKKGPVTFSHNTHNKDYKIACADCHHVYDGGKNTWKEGNAVQKCSECHDAVKSKGKVKKLMLAYHKNCQGCHKKLKKAAKKTGPTTKCNQCHQKKQ